MPWSPQTRLEVGREGLPAAGLVVDRPRGSGKIDPQTKTGPQGGRVGEGLLTRTCLPQGPSLPFWQVLLPFPQISFSYTQAHDEDEVTGLM